MPFGPLNTITAYQFGDSLLLPEAYVSRVKELGYLSCGISDSNRFAFPSFAKCCRKEGIKPVFGLRIPLSSLQRDFYNAVLFIKNDRGYENLCQLVSEKKKLYGIDILSQYHEGLMLVLSFDDPLFFQEEYQTRISKELFAYKKIFGEDFYLGVRLESNEDRSESGRLFDFIDSRGYPSVAFPCSRYLSKSDAGKRKLFHSAWKKEKASYSTENGPEFLLSPNGIRQVYREKEIEGTSDRIDKIEFDFFKKRGSLIRFDDEDEKLEEKAIEGLKKRFGNPMVPEDYTKRLSYELSVIKERKFSSYFLLVGDYVGYARNSGIYVGPGRGSAGGSLVAYALGITQLDPMKFSLSFERFLNPKRQTRPDIDRDFEDRRRNEVVSYLKRRYGETHCADIVTFSSLKPRSAINLVGAALDYPSSRLKLLTSLLPEQADDFSSASRLRKPYQKKKYQELRKDDYYSSLVSLSSSFIGLPVNTSVHAAGVILSQDELFNHVPRSNGKTGTVLYEYPYREELGFLKVDILSLSNLSFIHEIEDKRKADGIAKEDLRGNLNDKEAFKERNDLHLARIFQLDNSYGFSKAIKKVRPDSYSDLASLLALYRPGPMEYISSFAKRKHGEEKIEYKSSLLEPILKETYGIRVYQEQVRRAVYVLASFSLGDADLFRRAISKKDAGKRKEYEPKFYEGAKKNGIPEDRTKSIYEDILKFAGYGFNKSHAYCYAFITYTRLYYKAHYPKEFYECAFAENSLSSKKSLQLRKELKDKGIHRKRPDINESDGKDYVLEGKSCRIPLSQVKQCDGKLISSILSVRKEKGPFASYYDFFVKRDGKRDSNSVKTLTSLVEAGAFDSLCPYREERVRKISLYRSYASMSFPMEQVPAIEATKEDIGLRLRNEKERLGIIMSCPLNSVAYRKGYRTLIVTDVSSYERNGFVAACRELEDYKIRLGKKGAVEKGGFLLIPEEEFEFGKTALYPHNFVYLGKERK